MMTRDQQGECWVSCRAHLLACSTLTPPSLALCCPGAIAGLHGDNRILALFTEGMTAIGGTAVSCKEAMSIDAALHLG